MTKRYYVVANALSRYHQAFYDGQRFWYDKGKGRLYTYSEACSVKAQLDHRNTVVVLDQKLEKYAQAAGY